MVSAKVKWARGEIRKVLKDKSLDREEKGKKMKKVWEEARKKYPDKK